MRDCSVQGQRTSPPQSAKDCGGPRCDKIVQEGSRDAQAYTVCSEEAQQADISFENFALDFEPDGESDLAVDERFPFTEEDNAFLRKLVKQIRPRGPVTLGLLKLWSSFATVGLPRAFYTCSERALPVVRLHRPSPQQLFEHVLRNQPVVISGAFDEHAFPPLRDFCDFDYLRCRCGDRCVKVKEDSFIDRDGRQVFVADPSTEMTVAQFLDCVEVSECTGEPPGYYFGKIKLNEEIPELAEDIDDSPDSPAMRFESCFSESHKGAHMYFGCAQNTSTTHVDPSENLTIQIFGTKRYCLFPPSDADYLYPVGAPAYMNSAVPPFMAPDAMRREFRERFPLYHRHGRPQYVDLKPGDLLYTPIFWWHGVMGSSERNMMLNWFVDMHPSKEAPAGKSWRLQKAVDPGLLSQGAHAVLLAISRHLQG